MTQQNINFGTTRANDGEDLFSAFTKIQANFSELYTDATSDAAALAAHIADTSAAHDASAVSFTQSGTGAVERTALAKMRETVTVADFGAAADFTYASQTGTNNATAFQNAINAVGTGAIVKIPAGFYRLTSALTVADKNITFEGEGSAGTHLIFDDCNGLTLVIDDADNKGAQFRGISFVSTANGTRTGVSYTGKVGSGAQLFEAIFEDCSWFGADRILLLAWGANPSNNRCSWLKPIDLNTADRVSFRDCMFIAQQRAFTDTWPYASIGLDIDDATSVSLDRCEFYSFETAIKSAGTTENIQMRGCTVVANRYGLIALNSSPFNEHVLQGNHFSNYDVDVDIDSGAASQSGFHTVTGNFFMRRADANTTGFYHLKGRISYTDISGNVFAQVDPALTPVASGDIAIRLYGNSADNLIHHNIFYRQNICVQIDSGATTNSVDANHTVDDGTTVSASFLSDSGTNTIIGFNGGDRFTGGTRRFANTGLQVYDTNASHLLTIAPGSDLTANRQLTLTTGDAARTITLSGNPTLADWFDQAVKAASSPTFANPLVTTIELGHASDTTLARSGAGDVTIEGNAIYRAGGTDVPVTDGGTGASTSRLACANLSSGHVIAQTGAASTTLTGSTSETVLATISFAANSLGANGSIEVTAYFSNNNSGNSKTARVRIGAAGAGTGGTLTQAVAVTTTLSLKTVNEIFNRNATNSQVAGMNNGSIGAAAAAVNTAAIDTTAAFEVVITGQLANSGDNMALEAYRVKLNYSA